MASGDMVEGDHELARNAAGDEIDLVELFVILWEGKWLIAGITGFFGVLAAAFMFAATPVYQVEAVVGPASGNNIKALQPSILVDQDVVAREGVPINVPYQVQAVDVESLYQVAITQAQSLHIKRRFWEERLGRPASPSGASVEEQLADRAFRDFAKSIQISAPNASRMFAEVVLKTNDPIAGVELLASYLRFVDESTLRRVTRQLDFALESSLKRLEEDQAVRYREEKLKLRDELVRLQEAKGMAKSLGIVNTPYEQIENIRLTLLDNREYLLGTTVLDQQIAAIESRLEGSIEAFVPELRRMDRWREQMEGDRARLRSALDGLNALVVINPPEASLGPVAPNKPLIVLAAVFAAGMMSVIVVFIRHGVRRYRAASRGASL